MTKAVTSIQGNELSVGSVQFAHNQGESSIRAGVAPARRRAEYRV